MRLEPRDTGDLLCPSCGVALLVECDPGNIYKPKNGTAPCGRCGTDLKIQSWMTYKAEELNK